MCCFKGLRLDRVSANLNPLIFWWMAFFQVTPGVGLDPFRHTERKATPPWRPGTRKHDQSWFRRTWNYPETYQQWSAGCTNSKGIPSWEKRPCNSWIIWSLKNLDLNLTNFQFNVPPDLGVIMLMFRIFAAQSAFFCGGSKCVTSKFDSWISGIGKRWDDVKPMFWK